MISTYLDLVKYYEKLIQIDEIEDGNNLEVAVELTKFQITKLFDNVKKTY